MYKLSSRQVCSMRTKGLTTLDKRLIIDNFVSITQCLPCILVSYVKESDVGYAVYVFKLNKEQFCALKAMSFA